MVIKNKINITFTERGNSIEIDGTQVPINMITEEFYRVWPAEEPAYEVVENSNISWEETQRLFRKRRTKSHIIPR